MIKRNINSKKTKILVNKSQKEINNIIYNNYFIKTKKEKSSGNKAIKNLLKNIKLENF